MPDREDSILTLPGIGPKKAALFSRLGLHSLGDLLRFYPRDYEDRTKLVPIAELEPGQPACFLASVISNPQTHAIPKPGRQRLEVTKVVVADDTQRLHLTFFNQGYLTEKLRRGDTYCFYGALNGDFLGYAMTNPVFEPVESAGLLTRRILPVYPLTAGLSNKMVVQAVQAALARVQPQETLPERLRAAYDLCGAQEAIREIHTPSSAEALERARRRLIFEEFFVFSAALCLLRARRTVQSVPPYENTDLRPFENALPFRLTGAQRRAIDGILEDFRAGRPMSRLVQGDVGCGKTMVAAAAAYCAAKNGRQTALMAPTEILARQHYERLEPLFSALGISCALLTGSMTPAQKRECRRSIAQGEAEVVIGTHALLTETTVFSRLGLVIADEQHRFGVAQRTALLEKGERPHLLLMSATPIPRTLALLMYGDLEVSVIDELPPGRQEVETFLVSESYRARLNGFIRRQAEEGHQSFIVCPAIEEGETDGLKAAEQWAQTLQQQVFPQLRVALLHGKMKGSEKEEIMGRFAAGEFDLLVSTTVIEVGVDVPNATLMVIENADRFGLSQLHQLRGRIGRGEAKSYCVLVSDNRSPETLQRLQALCATHDGFRIAEEDLKLRGPGDFFGSRQHGLPVFRMGDLAQDLSLLRQAQEAAARTVADSGAALPPGLCEAVQALLQNGNYVLN